MCNSWSGEATFEYPIERAFHKPTKRFLNLDDPEIPEDANRDWDFVEIVLSISGNGYYMPAKLCGPPEDCYPEEEELEWIAEDDSGKNWSEELTDDEISDIEEKLVELIKENN